MEVKNGLWGLEETIVVIYVHYLDCGDMITGL